MSQLPLNPEICSAGTFAKMCGASVQDVLAWMDNGTVPIVQLADFRMVNIARIVTDLDKGKTSFNEGDYSHA